MLFSLILFFFLSYSECAEVCYGDLGCFSTDYPWTSLVRPFPKPEAPEKVNTKLFCYTRDNVVRRYNVTLRPEISLGGCHFKPGRPTVFIVHGFFNTGNYPWLNELKDAYLLTTDANVFIVDWGKGAVMINYFRASSNTRVVAAEILRVIKHLQKSYGLEASSLHLIGHSLGAQIMGYVGRDFPGTHRITGLDAAQHGFEASEDIVRLEKSDATFVELFHTNGLPGLGIGYVKPHGHVDFYMNGGQRQPLCEALDILTEVKNFNNTQDFIINSAQSLFFCSHNRPYEYFIDALRPNCSLWGRKASLSARTVAEYATGGLYGTLIPDKNTCDQDNCLPICLDTPKYKARGVFLVTTPMKHPFCENPAVNKRIISEMSNSKNNSQDNRVQNILLLEGAIGKTNDIVNQATNTVAAGFRGLFSLITKTINIMFVKP